MGARRGDAQADALRALGQLAANAADLVLELLDVRADLRADFHDRLVELAFDLIAERRRAGREQLGHVGSELARLGVHSLELLLDADREGVGHHEIIVQRVISCAGLRACTGLSSCSSSPSRPRRGCGSAMPAYRMPSASTSRRSSAAPSPSFGPVTGTRTSSTIRLW